MPMRKKGKHQRHADQRANTRKSKRKQSLENQDPNKINIFTLKFSTVYVGSFSSF